MTDPRLDVVLDRAVSRVSAAVSDAIDTLSAQIGALALSASGNLQRQVLMSAERELQLKGTLLRGAFGKQLRQQVAKINGDSGAGGSGHHVSNSDTNWATLSLVDNAEVERGVTAGRMAQALSHGCDAELAALTALVTALLDDPNPERNPLRPHGIARALLAAIAELNSPDDVAQALAHHFGRVLSPALATCYGQIVTDLRSQGITPRGLSIKRTRSTSSVSGGIHATNPGGLSEDLPAHTHPGPIPDSKGAHITSGYQQRAPLTAEAHHRAAQALSEMFGVSMPMPRANDTLPIGLRNPHAPPAPGTLPAVSPDFQDLLRQIAAQSSPTDWTADLAGTPGGLHSDDGSGLAGPLMAINMIRAHREALVKASGGAALDQMVIDIVAALFDQVLSDPKVSPQMARQLARLQMPVLRVALADLSFFNSRKHPVRTFVNRMATLSASFDDHDSGPGQACLDRITALVNEIVQGNFDRMDTYGPMLSELESFMDSENAREASEHAAVAAMLNGKEADLRVHQRYMQILKRELTDVAMPDFLREFLLQIWSQVQVMAAARDGAQSPFFERMKAAGHSLALSLQPKGHPQLRKAFLLKLPQLMKDLNEGLGLIQWPEKAKQAFFAQLLPAHAECLKAAPQHDLTQRLLEHQLAKVKRIAIPSREEAANDPLPAALSDIKAQPVPTMVTTLSATEIQAAGFLPEAELAAEGPLDIDLNLPSESDPTLKEIDINLDVPAPPSAGLQLMHHIHQGAAYQMMMQGQWKKVRLTWVSDGRTFFIFNQGHPHKQTISLTARTLAKMCESGRFKAFEQAELIERATVRARRQLAALSSGGRHSPQPRAHSAA